MTPPTSLPLATLRALILPVLTQPGNLQIGVQDVSGGKVFTVRTHGADMSRMVGKGGVNVRALKAICEALSQAERLTFILTDPSADSRPARAVDQHRDWNTSPVEMAVKGVLACQRKPTMLAVCPAGDETSFVLPCTLPAPLFEALARWVSVMAHSLGGTAFLRQPGVTPQPA